MSVFLDRNHLLARKPSDAGDPYAMKAAGFGACFANIGDYEAPLWEDLRQRSLAAGLVFGPWLRTADGHNEFDPARFGYLLDVAEAWGSPLVVNSEKEIDHTGDDITGYMADELAGRDAAISMEVRPFGAVDWKPLGRAGFPVLPQNFPRETGIWDTDDAIRQNWWAAGMECVVITYGTYGGASPVDYPRLSPYGLYTADDCGNDFARWASAGSCEPCKVPPPKPPDGGGDMEKIGNQHGVTAAMNRLRTLDPGGTALVRGSDGKWPPLSTLQSTPLDKWKAYDKLERTLTILVQDHDASG